MGAQNDQQAENHHADVNVVKIRADQLSNQLNLFEKKMFRMESSTQ